MLCQIALICIVLTWSAGFMHWGDTLSNQAFLRDAAGVTVPEAALNLSERKLGR